ncbi:MAG TPA: glycoside-pentoside-hexuronide (GPH):cation symporter [Propionibacteriaceae bacterium]|nr:glycoside-pentoside-hexuronide (GPH):cation symporter [Propionibacteriaceae bacterium]HQE30506.1 glycoside-pentoside-hexuronide (GPH):cation symporter [Propionibacteriaceae bacterium]
MAAPYEARNRWTFATGTLGRDMTYMLVSFYLTYFLSDILDLPDDTLIWVAWLLLAARLVDAVLDIGMGAIVDNTRTRWGQFKPWIVGGVVASAVMTVLLFSDPGVRGPWAIVYFGLVYLLWSLAWTANDIPYWSLLPALTLDQKERERIGALAKIFATVGTFSVVGAIVPLTHALTPSYGASRAWTYVAVGIVVLMVLGQMITVVGVREPGLAGVQERTTVRELAGVVFRNDQLLAAVVGLLLFMTGYLTTTAFGLYFFKYAYRDEAMYTPFGVTLGVAMLLGYLLFPLASRRFARRTIYTVATVMVLVGYVIFFFAPMNLWLILAAGLIVFFAQAWVTLLMIMFFADTIEYGQWKLGRRNQAVTFALQPFVNKVASALANQVVAIVVVVSGINAARTPDDVTPAGLLMMKVAMMGFPALLIAAGYLIYRRFYTLDEARHAAIVGELKERGELVR